jgi:hypothetical protein
MYKATLIVATLSVRPSFKVKHLFCVEKRYKVGPVGKRERKREREGIEVYHFRYDKRSTFAHYTKHI